MALVTVHIENDVQNLLERMAKERNQSLQFLVNDIFEGAVKEQREIARKELLRLIDSSTGEVGPITWSRDDIYVR